MKTTQIQTAYLFPFRPTTIATAPLPPRPLFSLTRSEARAPLQAVYASC